MSIKPALAAALLAALGMSACKPAAPAATASAAPLSISGDDFNARVRELADDKYQGRGPGTPAGEAAAQWVADEMKRIGLEPGGDNGTYFQTVEMVAQTVDPAKSSLVINARGRNIPLAMGTDAVYITKHQRDTDTTVKLENSDLIFVGYGVTAPEQQWDDYAGIDVHGKTVVMFVNDPGFVTHDDSLFNGRAMTYYGRWTYKYEEAARHGAAGVLLIHETEPAAYGWNVVRDSWTGEQADLVRDNGGADRAQLEGWITLERARELFTAAGLDIDAQRAAANKRGFRAVPMTGLKANATITQTIRRTPSRNVIGTLPGTSHPDEHVIFTAHWDHLGMKEADPAHPDADLISNGAVDNATGVAGILEIAEAMKAAGPMARSVTFIAVTLEESGLLGSAYYAEHPTIPLNKIVAGINIDALQPAGRTKDVIVIGAGASQLEDILTDVLRGQNRVVRPDAAPEAGYFYRSDHISLAKKGVPMLYADSGIDLVEGGEAAGTAGEADYREHRYHGVEDEWSASWNVANIVEDLTALGETARRIASGSDWPTWRAGNEFEAIRKTSLGQ
jgi:Zn-dependent M28 family amino/carboxypeptidase